MIIDGIVDSTNGLVDGIIEEADLNTALKNIIGGGQVSTRNGLLTGDILSQSTAPTAGVSSTIYTGNGTSQSVTTGIDMSTGNLGGLVWIKNRSSIQQFILADSVRGATNFLQSPSTAAEITADASKVASLDTTGFSVGASAETNNNTDNIVAWSFQTNQKTTGTTNRNKAYTAHYNADMGFSIVNYVGDGTDGHEIPHHLGKTPDLSIFKGRDEAASWNVMSPLFNSGDYLIMNANNALANATNRSIVFGNNTVAVSSNNESNSTGKNLISYHFTSIPGVSKVGKYIGTGVAGNYVDCGFKPSFVLIKWLNGAGEWQIQDSIRGDYYLTANNSSAEAASGTNDLNYTDTGFVLTNGGGDVNALNGEYIFLAFAETSKDATKAIANYNKPINADQLGLANPITMTFANGFDASGQVDSQEQVLGGTLTFGAGYEDKKLYIYRDKDTAWGFSEVRPLTGLTRDDADKSGVVSPSDSTLRTTAKHFDYESETGVVQASGEWTTAYAWKAFNGSNYDLSGGSTDSWGVASTTNAFLQYKHTEPRILKSWRFSSEIVARSPKRFTIEGSNDGLNWTEIDSTYKATTGIDYVPNGAQLWGNLHSTSSNTTPYSYHRINITANNGDATYTSIAELELNTKIASDYYLEPQGKIFNDAGTRLDRVYVGECLTDASGNVTSFVNYSSGKKLINEAEFLGKAVFHGEALNKAFATAWVNFDGTKSPPLIKDSYNVKGIVDLGTGNYNIVFEVPMSNKQYTLSGAPELSNRSISGGDRNVNFAEVKTYITSTGALEDNKANVILFGGKEIKGDNS